MTRKPGVELLLLGIILLGSGCVSIVRSEIGLAPDAATVAQVRKGATFEEVLGICGVPLETIEQPDGRVLIYRERHYQFRRVGLEPALLAGLVDITGLVRAALANVKLVFEWGKVEERRAVILFDEDERVAAVAYRARDGER